MSNRLDTHLARAIRKYGKDAFCVEQIDSASSQEELNAKEVYWINYYNSTKEGYNMTSGSLGGNTYEIKSADEMSEICEKLRDSKLGGKNPMARSVKCRNLITGEELRFASCAEARDYFHEGNHNFITRRCLGKTTYLYKGEWQFAYEEEPYSDIYCFEKKHRKGDRINVKDLFSGEEHIFNSFASGERYFGLKPKTFSGKAYLRTENTFLVQERYMVTRLN